MKKLAELTICFALFFVSLVGCSTIRDTSSNWAGEQNGKSYCYGEDEKTPHNCTDAEIQSHMLENDYTTVRREGAAVFNRKLGSVPSYNLEKEAIYLYSGIKALTLWESYLQLPTDTVNREKMVAEIPIHQRTALLYARKLLEISPRHLASHLFISRAFELVDRNSGLPSDIAAKIKPGIKRWQFVFSPPTSSGFLLVGDFRSAYQKYYQERRGDEFVNLARTVCSGLLFCLAGFRGLDTGAVELLNNTIGVKFSDGNGPLQVAGLYDHTFRTPCGNGGIFDSSSGIYNHECGKEFVKLEAGWQELYD
jgi:hypothetical protein